ncbi:hypothetical protein [Nitrososphaeria virus YSH_462411]|uniref:Uncharacterized protein n=1 Tax=Nitrososphaeria virus YSH_462411 TaxID=3071321 RepID=A0A976YF12_9CAUD|nr:hypothetical protein QKV92_gp34 [Yangshan Harbor Nitrososphaeria virus]UVF62306.1 hypothetical protein [Nitrososphaeria virus YSH_462411]
MSLYTYLYNFFWISIMLKLNIRPPIPKELLDFDDIHTISETAKEELFKE